MYYKCRKFKITELVSKEMYSKRGEQSWELLNPLALQVLDLVSNTFGTTLVNTKSNYNWSGLRDASSPYYSNSSQHTLGNAFDIKNKNLDWKTFAKWIKKGWERGCPIRSQVTFIEADTEGWVHFDVRNSPELTVWSIKTKKVVENY